VKWVGHEAFLGQKDYFGLKSSLKEIPWNLGPQMEYLRETGSEVVKYMFKHPCFT
jgi:hypothetical protein